jgi:hypothetical protein
MDPDPTDQAGSGSATLLQKFVVTVPYRLFGFSR